VLRLDEWTTTPGLRDRPWLILGKGPTFGRRDEFDLSQYRLLALNHVVRELPVDVAHAIDVDVVADCAQAIRQNSKWLIMPRRPHVENRPGPLLEEHFDDVPVLRELAEAGRLVWYNLSNAEPVGDAPVIRTRYFSVEAALGILVEAGVRQVRTLGIDGGRAYSRSFADLEQKTMLSNTRVSFDDQFDEIERTVRESGIDYAPLVQPPEAIRVFVGCDESQLVAASVLEHTIRKHSRRRVEFTKMIDLHVPEPKDPANRARTGFSFYRFMIPKLAGYHGRALYLDSDMQVFADMGELWEIPLDGHTVLCTNQPEPPVQWKDDPNFKPGRHLAVMMLDCERLRWDVDEIIRGLDDGRYDYKQLMSDLVIVPEEQIAESIPVEWNHLETYEPGKTKLLHYTVVSTQPWKNHQNPLGEVWMEAYRDALAQRAVDPALVVDAVEKGHVKPSLADELHHSPLWNGERPSARPSADAGAPKISTSTRVRLKLRSLLR
jgi:hypothetical protein